MRILFTGGVGRIGTVVVKRLLERGHQVRVIDNKTDVQPPQGSEYAVCDITDYPSLREHFGGCQAVVHLAAYPSPASGAGHELFRVNAAGTFNIFQAAAEEGIRRVVQASSINAIGMHFGVRNEQPRSFPVDEDEPPQTTDGYSFSKWIVEEIGAYFSRREGISSIALRFPGVRPPDTPEQKARRHGLARKIVDRALSMPEDARAAWLDEQLAQIAAIRAKKLLENREFMHSRSGPQSQISDELYWLMFNRTDFWASLDERDAAQAIEKSLTAEYEGSHALFVSDLNNAAGVESELLLRLFFTTVTARKRPLAGTESLVSIEKARRLVGFEPEYTFG